MVNIIDCIFDTDGIVMRVLMCCQYGKTILVTERKIGYRQYVFTDSCKEDNDSPSVLTSAMEDGHIRSGRERQFLRDFIAEYKELTCLWDVRSKDYSNRDKKESAYDKLLII